MCSNNLMTMGTSTRPILLIWMVQGSISMTSITSLGVDVLLISMASLWEFFTTNSNKRGKSKIFSPLKEVYSLHSNKNLNKNNGSEGFANFQDSFWGYLLFWSLDPHKVQTILGPNSPTPSTSLILSFCL